MKYPVGIQDFKSIINGGYVYVDKTALIHKLLDEGKIYFLSRPRRFGKSLLVSTLEYYFKGEKELFQGLAIEKLEKNWETYPVFHIDFNSTDFTDGQALRNKLMAYVSEWEEHYGVVPVTGQGVGDRFAHVLEHIHNTTGKRSVVLIDEYDKP
ncbi:MAG: AAA family ATPase, partial [Prevotella sp.]|nr:AAA family ATPase [Prevotella sp.]